MIKKNYKIMIYLKRVTRKLDKYIEDKNKKKLEIRVLKNIILSSILKNIRNY